MRTILAHPASGPSLPPRNGRDQRSWWRVSPTRRDCARRHHPPPPSGGPLPVSGEFSGSWQTMLRPAASVVLSSISANTLGNRRCHFGQHRALRCAAASTCTSMCSQSRSRCLRADHRVENVQAFGIRAEHLRGDSDALTQPRLPRWANGFRRCRRNGARDIVRPRRSLPAAHRVSPNSFR